MGSVVLGRDKKACLGDETTAQTSPDEAVATVNQNFTGAVSLLTLAARRVDVLARLAEKIAAASGPRPLVIECDVTRDGDVERAVSETLGQRGRLDIVFANAGFGVAGPFAKLSLADYRRQFETNVFGVLRTLYAALPELTRSKGQLVITGSVAGWVA